MDLSSDKLREYWAVADALSAIRDKCLYRETHSSFEQYCRETWGDEVYEIFLGYLVQKEREDNGLN